MPIDKPTALAGLEVAPTSPAGTGDNNPAPGAFLPDAPSQGQLSLEEELAAEALKTPFSDDPTFGRVGRHNFWTSPALNYDPKAQFRFIVRIPGMGLEDARPIKGDLFADHQDASAGLVWYAKTIDKPGYQLIDLTENMYFNSSTKAAPAPQADNPTLKKITMTLIDPVYPNATRKLVRYLRRSGFQETKAAAAALLLGGADASYIETSAGGKQSIPKLEIVQLSSLGEEIETWTLIDPYPAEVDFGKLDYSSDDLVEITVTWGYRTFTVDFPAIGNEQPYKYFKDTQGVVVPPDDPPLPANPCKDIPGYKEMYPNECAGTDSNARE